MNRTEVNYAETNDNAIPTRIGKLDNLLGGLRAGELIILASRPEVDKSAFALNVMNNVVMSELVSGLYITASVTSMIAERNLCMIGGDGTFEMIHGLGDYPENLFHIKGKFTDYASLKELFDTIRIYKKNHDVKFVIIDRLSPVLLNIPVKPDQLTEGLKKLADELDITIMMLVSFGRGMEYRNGRAPELKDFKKRSFYVDKSDVLMALTREGYSDVLFEGDGPYDAELTILKNRYGDIGSVELSWFPSTLRFLDRVEKSDDDSSDTAEKSTGDAMADKILGECSKFSSGDIYSDKFSRRQQKALIDGMSEILKILPETERRIITSSFGLDGDKKTYAEIAKENHMSEEDVKRLEVYALRKLRHPRHNRKLKKLVENIAKDGR